jgi:farnesyl-diphosphate farnesyltransferase
VADTPRLAREDRLRHLHRLRRAFAGEPIAVEAMVADLAPGPSPSAEYRLLQRTAEAIARLEAVREPDRADVRRVLQTITSGQIFDLEQFPGEDVTRLAALATEVDLDRYTYLVAGCVGEFWTAIHVRHRPALAGWDVGRMSAQGQRFGKALQLTNVLRDAPRDLRAGRCYLPADGLARLGLAPRDLLDAERAPAARPLLGALLATALAHYDVAWRYTLAIPRREWRMRLACAWPLLIGLATLRAFAREPNPLAAEPVKIPRSEVRRLLARSAPRIWSDRALAAEARRLRPALPGGDPGRV